MQMHRLELCWTDRKSEFSPIAARHAFNDIPKSSIVQIGGRFGADVSNSYSLSREHLELVPLTRTRRWLCSAFRMMDKDDFESFIRSTASADFLADPVHATIKKAVDEVEAEQPDHIEVKTHYLKTTPQKTSFRDVNYARTRSPRSTRSTTRNPTMCATT